MEKKKIDFIINKLQEMFPDAKCELDYTNLYELIIAVALSAQTTDVRVNIVTKELFKAYPDCYSLAKASYYDVLNIIKSVGLSNTKSKNIIALANELVNRFDGKVPHTMEELITLPGVGRKTSNVVLAEGFGIPAIAVDTHVARIANRLGFSNSEDVLKIEQDLMNQIEKEKWHQTHHMLIFFGRYFCKAKNPNCEECPFKKDICTVYKNN